MSVGLAPSLLGGFLSALFLDAKSNEVMVPRWSRKIDVGVLPSLYLRNRLRRFAGRMVGPLASVWLDDGDRVPQSLFSALLTSRNDWMSDCWTPVCSGFW